MGAFIPFVFGASQALFSGPHPRSGFCCKLWLGRRQFVFCFIRVLNYNEIDRGEQGKRLVQTILVPKNVQDNPTLYRAAFDLRGGGFFDRIIPGHN